MMELVETVGMTTRDERRVRFLRLHSPHPRLPHNHNTTLTNCTNKANSNNYRPSRRTSSS